jgi:hypothetical protein
MKKNRWYDRYAGLAKHLDNLQTMNTRPRNKLVQNIIDTIRETEPQLLESFVLDFPLDILRRRWYDKDPYLWLIFNGLRSAEEELIMKVEGFFKEKRRAGKKARDKS